MNETSTQRQAKPWSRVDRAPDGRSASVKSSDQAGILRPTSGRFWGMVGLVILTGVTSLVVATISIWLTPVYMAAMVLIFAAPRSNRPVAPASPPPSESLPEPAETTEASPEAAGVEAATEGTPEGTAEAVATAEDADPAASPKPRKRRSKGKRAARAAALAEASSSQPTWIRVGPGKFVRADLQAPPSEAEAPAEPTPAADPEIPEETESPTEVATESWTDAEAAPTSAPDGLVVADEAVAMETFAEETPATAIDEGPSELDSTAPPDADEAAPTTPDEEYGIAPSALVENDDEEYGIAPSALVEASGEEYGNAPSALVETWEPVALPDAVPDDEPASAPEPSTVTEPAAQVEVHEEVATEIEFPVETEVREDVAEVANAEIPMETESPTTIAPPLLARPAPEGSATASPSIDRPAGLGLLRRLSRVRERCDRARVRSPRPRGEAPRTAQSGRSARITASGRSGRDRRRVDKPRRRPYPRSPPPRRP
ncbi:hypothetical protein [Planctomyces sp. SH-PL62]|uniref:hypothetical protein n=1 Tax=Planctomyces sp. SH-PL62 TaxID=1636152 RepID=UPI00083945E6|nr:hypothetical protein [Planctomyces sp. SH-PL62]